ncbi:MAG: hypothetical protein AAFW46_15505 [Pseudomonadota bacterium]
MKASKSHPAARTIDKRAGARRARRGPAEGERGQRVADRLAVRRESAAVAQMSSRRRAEAARRADRLERAAAVESVLAAASARTLRRRLTTLDRTERHVADLVAALLSTARSGPVSTVETRAGSEADALFAALTRPHRGPRAFAGPAARAAAWRRFDAVLRREAARLL